ncbi:hypothetical protein V8Z80_08230 [Orrella sp. JC864]|uniref:hypothetical protein n=1 Tax=Orrella sp. JC864 TaxID=3120298 RepID=UPI003008B162
MPKPPKLKPDHVFIEVVRGPEGLALYVANDDGGHRLAGPKPWGGGRTIHQFQVKLSELLKEAPAFAPKDTGHASGQAQGAEAERQRVGEAISQFMADNAHENSTECCLDWADANNIDALMDAIDAARAAGGEHV